MITLFDAGLWKSRPFIPRSWVTDEVMEDITPNETEICTCLGAEETVRHWQTTG